MKRSAIAVLSFAVGTALCGAAFAQGRHDEKPHGMGKPAEASKSGEIVQPGTAGRHDEKPHGPPKKRPVKKPAAKQGAEAEKGGKQ